METDEDQPILFGLGNTFIDWYAVTDQALLDKYGLAFGLPGKLTLEQRPVLKDLEIFDGYHEMPGGSTVNTIRAFNYLMDNEHNIKHSALYFGAIGADDKGKIIKKLFDSEGIIYWFDEHEGFFTDQWAIIIVNSERTPFHFVK